MQTEQMIEQEKYYLDHAEQLQQAAKKAGCSTCKSHRVIYLRPEYARWSNHWRMIRDAYVYCLDCSHLSEPPTLETSK